MKIRLITLMVVAGVILAACATSAGSDGEGGEYNELSAAEIEELGYDPAIEALVYPSETNFYGTVEEMAGDADLVVRGRVTGLKEGRITDGGETRTEIMSVELRITDVVVGDVRTGDLVSFPWMTRELANSDDTVTRDLLVAGIRAPKEGQEVVVFLIDMPADQELDMKNRPTHYLASFDGILDTDGRQMRSELRDTTQEGEAPRLGLRIAALTYDELVGLIGN